MSYTTISKCRVCGCSDLTPLFSIGSQYVSDFVDSPNGDQSHLVPIELVLCKRCTLVQLLHTAPQDFLYTRHYWYRSGVTDTMRRSLRSITSSIESLMDLKPEDIVLDIGSNDGTLLRSYKSKRITKVGVEPANNLVKEGSRGVDILIHDFWNYQTYCDKAPKRAKVVTAIGMFYDLENPNQFISDVSKCLRIDGLFIAQLMCLKNMLDLGDVGNLAHEHLEFYSYRSLQYLFKSHELEIIDIETNNVNGRSYRIYARPKGGSVKPKTGAKERIEDVKESEKHLHETGAYVKFVSKIQTSKRLTVRFVKDKILEGKKVWVYGASTKGNVLLQYYGLDHSLIEGASDRSPEKWGKYTVGTRIPIYSEEHARKVNPDFFLVLPYAFIGEFLVRERTWRDGGGKFIIPLPKFEVL